MVTGVLTRAPVMTRAAQARLQTRMIINKN